MHMNKPYPFRQPAVGSVPTTPASCPRGPAQENLASGTFARPLLPTIFSLLLFLLLASFVAPLARAQQQFGDFYYSGEGDSAITITYYVGNGGAVVIPSTIAGHPVTTIRYRAFEQKSSITSVTIPSSVTSIGEAAFQYCSGLTSVTLPSSLKSIGHTAFQGCTKLTTMTLPSGLTSIGNSAFDDCLSLTSVTIPSGVASIGDRAFYGCSGLTSLTISSGVTKIGYGAFQSCTGLTAVTIPSGVTSIGSYAFYNCTGLTSLTIPGSVTSIEYRAFSYCEGLTSLTIPSGVTSIEGYAFSDCTGLTTVTLPSGVTSIGPYAFSNCTGLTSLTLPNSVASIEDRAFSGCRGLTAAIFEGDAPASFGAEVFNGTAPGFTIYYQAGATGFTSPTWKGYPTVVPGVPLPTLTEWREQHFGEGATNTGNAANDADPDGDGFTNADEYTAGTDPKSAGSALQVETVTKLDATYTVTIEAQPSRRYELQRLVSAPGATWQTVATQEPQAEAGPLSLTDSVAPTDAALYRVRVTLP